MKKLLTTTLFLITIFCQSQTIRTTYRACPKYTYVKFDGSYQAYLNAIYLSGYTPSSVAYSPTELVFPSGLTLPKSWYVYYDSVTYDLAYRDSVMFTNMFNEDQRYVYPPYIANTDGYARMIDTVGGTGNGKIMPTALAMSSIKKINDSISVRYTKSVSDGRFKSISYSPSGSEINTALGYTPYNGSTNPLGFLLSSGSYSNPSWLNSLAFSKITGFGSTQVTSALGLTPVDQAGARSAISLTTTGSSGAATYNNSTGVLNVPQYTAPAISVNNSPGRSVVSTTGATGFQISASRPAMVSYSVTINTTVSLSGNSTGYVVLQVCSTNSSTPGDWQEIARTPSGQSGSLVVGLTLNQIGGGNLSGVVPLGWYAKILSVNTSGTPTYTYNSGQEVLFN